MNTVRPATKADIAREKTRAQREERILRRAAAAFRERERLEQKLRVNEARLAGLCRMFDDAAGTRGFGVSHLRRAAETRGIL